MNGGLFKGATHAPPTDTMGSYDTVLSLSLSVAVAFNRIIVCLRVVLGAGARHVDGRREGGVLAEAKLGLDAGPGLQSGCPARPACALFSLLGIVGHNRGEDRG